MNLTEAEDIKKRWQEYTKELYKKDVHDTNESVCKAEIDSQRPDFWVTEGRDELGDWGQQI